jgi:hypothetical protein
MAPKHGGAQITGSPITRASSEQGQAAEIKRWEQRALAAEQKTKEEETKRLAAERKVRAKKDTPAPVEQTTAIADAVATSLQSLLPTVITGKKRKSDDELDRVIARAEKVQDRSSERAHEITMELARARGGGGRGDRSAREILGFSIDLLADPLATDEMVEAELKKITDFGDNVTVRRALELARTRR